MKEEKDEPFILSYKDANINHLIDPDDFLKFIEDPKIKEEIDSCLNDLR